MDQVSRSGLRLYDPNMIMRAKPTYSRDDVASQAAAAERSVLAQERAIKSRAPGAKTHTTYTYATGPDGRPYITGASVSIVGTEEQLGASSGGARPAGLQAAYRAPEQREPGQDETRRDVTDDPKVRAQIAQLEQRQNEVIAHEAAHMAAGGQFAGSASYTYTTGPDGKQYITGGEVPISTPATSDPSEALQNALQVLRAAIAPGSPSGPDMAVAASAAQMAAQARIEMATQEGASTGEAATVGGDDPEGFDPLRGAQAGDAYAATRSPKGLWTESGGYDPRSLTPKASSGQEAEKDPYRLAA